MKRDAPGTDSGDELGNLPSRVTLVAAQQQPGDVGAVHSRHLQHLAHHIFHCVVLVVQLLLDSHGDGDFERRHHDHVER